MFISSILSMLPLLGLFMLSCFLLIHKFYDYKKKLTSTHTPQSYPLLGCLISFYKNRFRLLDWFTELLADSPTQTIVVERLGGTRTIVTANPENVEYMLKTNYNNYPKGKTFTDILGDLLGNGIFNVDGELWRTQRKLASHGFTTNCLKEFIMTTLKEEVENRLIPILESAMEEKKVVDMQDLLRRFAFDIICKVSLGTDMGYLDPSLPASPLASAFDIASLISARRGAAPMQIVWKIKRALGIGSEQQLKDAIQQVHQSVVDIICNKKSSTAGNVQETGGADILSRMIAAGHDDEMIRDMIISLIMAGKDSTSAVMTWLFWSLSQHSHIEEELVKEIVNNDHISGERSSLEFYEGLKNEMGFMKACIFESMRLYPAVFWDSKHPLVDDSLPDGTKVKKGDRVTYFPYGMGRMESLWGKDRFEFKPDRWFAEPEKEGGELKNVSPYKYPVFQAGPRVCLGKEMAILQMKYVLASVLKRFEIRPVNSNQPVFVPLLTAHMAGGLKVTIRKRIHQSLNKMG